ncbi:hypothetical protein [Chryseobacterium phosphatilyticum]|nr:hypothetical protein [Chryseobacterium phosphatilyticum]
MNKKLYPVVDIENIKDSLWEPHLIDLIQIKKVKYKRLEAESYL